MYVVRRAFKSLGTCYEPGSVITEPGLIKRFKTRLAERVIIEVNEHNFDKYAEYFSARFGVNLDKEMLNAEAPLIATEESEVVEAVLEPVVVKAVPTVAKAVAVVKG